MCGGGGVVGVLVVAVAVVAVSAKPIVDPGLFVIQGVTSCLNGTGYCLLGHDCTVDVDFLADTTGGHCDGLRDAFTPMIDFVCCQYNPLGKATSKPPTTTISSYTITDVFSIIDDHVDMNQQEDEIPEDVDPGSIIDIVGVVTDFTGIVGLVTRPWTGTFPTKATTPTTTPMTSSNITPTSTPRPSPATPPSFQDMEGVTQDTDAFTSTTPEPTESYNEIPDHMDEGDHEEHTEETQQDDVNIPSGLPQDTATSLGYYHDTTTPGSTHDIPQSHTTSTQSPPPVPTTLRPLLTVSPAQLTTHAPSPTSGEEEYEDIFADAIIFPDNPLLAGQHETEELEAVNEATMHTQEEIQVEAQVDEESQVEGQVAGQVGSAVIHILETNSVNDHNIQVAATSLAPNLTIETTSTTPAIPPQDVLDYLSEGAAGGLDYDYYSNYPDQILLQPVNQNICGFKGTKNYEESSSSRILGGVVASTVEWCWVAAIMERRQGGNKYVCTGALVESDLVLTTATCLKRLQNRDLNDYLVVLGDSNLKEDLPYGIQFHSIAEVVTHPDYFTSGGAHSDDIGVMRLRGHATLSNNVCLVCLAQQDAAFPATSCTVTGYGLGDVPMNVVREVRETVPKEGLLRQLTVPLLEEEECKKALHNVTGSHILASSHAFLCAGGLDNGMACYSTLDGGSPLACEAGGRWFLAGLVSWSRDCTRLGTPNIYTRVAYYTNWLQATHLRMMGFATHQIKLT